MDVVFTVIRYMMLGFVGFIGLLFVLAFLFGKRMVTKWDYEAEFTDASGREFGELDIELSRIEKEEPHFSLKAKFNMRHAAFQLHQTVRVYIDDVLLLEGMVKSAGRVRLTHEENLQNEITDAKAGQMCRVVYGGRELFAEALLPD